MSFRKSPSLFVLSAAILLTACAPVDQSLPLQPAAPPVIAPEEALTNPAAPALLDETILQEDQSFAVYPPIPIPAFELAPELPTPSALATRLPILEYHYSTFKMGDGVRMETDWFESQLQWLDENGYITITSQQLADFVQGNADLPRRSVALTFDVGLSKFDDYTNVVIPALRRHGFHGIFFILASRTLDSCDDPTLACWPTVKQWADEGLISVGSHTWTHLDYQALSPEQIYFDAAHSKALIEEKTGQAVLGLCYPFDSINPAAFDLLKALDYQFAVGGFTRTDRSALFNDGSPYDLPRYYPYSGDYYPIIGGTHGQTFDEMLLGAID